MLWQPSTTWAFVRISPLALITTPEPLEISAACPAITPLNRVLSAIAGIATNVAAGRCFLHNSTCVRSKGGNCDWRLIAFFSGLARGAQIIGKLGQIGNFQTDRRHKVTLSRMGGPLGPCVGILISDQSRANRRTRTNRPSRKHYGDLKVCQQAFCLIYNNLSIRFPISDRGGARNCALFSKSDIGEADWRSCPFQATLPNQTNPRPRTQHLDWTEHQQASCLTYKSGAIRSMISNQGDAQNGELY